MSNEGNGFDHIDPSGQDREPIAPAPSRTDIAPGDRIAVAAFACRRGYSPETVATLVRLDAGELAELRTWYRAWLKIGTPKEPRRYGVAL